MDYIKLYEIDPAYVQFLSGYAAHLFHNKQPGKSIEDLDGREGSV